MRPHFRFASLLGLIWFCAMQVTPVFAITPSIAMSGDAVAEQRPGKLFIGVDRFPVRLSISAHTPEPGIVAVLGFGLVLLGVSCWSASRAPQLSRGRQGGGRVRERIS